MYCGGNGDGRSHFFSRLIIANLSRQLLKTYRHGQLIAGICAVWYGCACRRTADCRACVCLRSSVSVFITVGGGYLFPLSFIDKQEGMINAHQTINEKI